MKKLAIAAAVAAMATLASAPVSAQHIDVGPGGIRVSPGHDDHGRQRDHGRRRVIEEDHDGRHARVCTTRTERVWDERDHHWVTRRVRHCEDD